MNDTPSDDAMKLAETTLMRCRFGFDGGDLVIEMPAVIKPDEIPIFEGLIELVLKGVRRRSEEWAASVAEPRGEEGLEHP